MTKAYFTYKVYKAIKRNKLPYTNKGQMINFGVIESWRHDEIEPEYHYFVRYGCDDNFSHWCEGSYVNQAVRRFVRSCRKDGLHKYLKKSKKNYCNSENYSQQDTTSA